MAAPLPLRTRLFSAIERVLSTPIDQVPREKIAARRTERTRLLASLPGRFVAGRAHIDARITDRTVELPAVDVPGLGVPGESVTARLRVYDPGGARAQSLPVVVLYHGGGWVLGNPEQNDWWASNLAVAGPYVVVAVAYRLAPEHPYPAAVSDSWATLQWTIDHVAEFGGDPSRIVVAGDSAGGNLAAVVADIAGETDKSALAGQMLIYPAAEMVEVFPSEREHADAPVLSSRNMRAFVDLYLDGADPYAPRAAPLHGTLAGAAVPALIQIAGHDPLRDNGVVYAEALRDNGGEVTLTEYEDAIHGYLSLPGVSPCAPRALAETVAFVRRVSS